MMLLSRRHQFKGSSCEIQPAITTLTRQQYPLSSWSSAAETSDHPEGPRYLLCVTVLMCSDRFLVSSLLVMSVACAAFNTGRLFPSAYCTC